MKKILKVVFLSVLLFLTIKYNKQITNFIIEKYIIPDEIYLEEANNYALSYNIEYLNKNDEFFAYNKNDLLNIVYTALNNGYDSFYFICKYDECKSDLSNLTNEEKFVDINNFVHPFNTYSNLYMSINSFGKVEVIVHKNYSEQEINIINEEIDKIIKNVIKNNMNDREKIKAFHDYIINTTKYDTDYIDSGFINFNHSSHKATGALIYKTALCGGYSDVTAIFLNKLKIPNYRISSPSHIWNLVYLDNEWYHLDLTWDDPITNNNENILLDTFFLIDTTTLHNLKTGHHNFNKNLYLEAN